ncbi:transposase [Streptomyces sp. NPDC020951]|uniref:transposase n=1 Tax=Streptomyces sp. NPDC020951 TaxID=3365104 RepID=UPI0037A42065
MAGDVLQKSDEWKARYKIRAGVEGVFSQGGLAHGLRRSRYRGLAKRSFSPISFINGLSLVVQGCGAEEVPVAVGSCGSGGVSCGVGYGW